jgi:enolase-phosphatase E1
MEAGVYAVVVDRPGNAVLSEDDRARFAVVERLTDLP